MIDKDKGEGMKLMIVLIALFIASPCTASDNPQLGRSVDALVDVLVDFYAKEQARKIHDLDGQNLKAVFFTLEGFNMGNNWQRYLAIFKKTSKRQQVPPFAAIGEAKYRLLGYLIIASAHKNFVKEESLIYKNRQLRIPSFDLSPKNRNQRLDDIVINIHAHSLQWQGRR